MASLYLISKTSTSITVGISGLQYDPCLYDDFAYYRDGVWKGQTGPCGSTYTYSGLSANTTYTLTAKAMWAGVWYNLTGNLRVTTNSSGGGTKLSTPYITSLSSTSTSVTVYWSSVSGADGYGVTCTNGMYQGQLVYYGLSMTFNGLNPNTQYGFKVKAISATPGVYDSDYSGWYYINTQAGAPGVPSSPPSLDTSIDLYGVQYSAGRRDSGFFLKCGYSVNAVDYTYEWRYVGNSWTNQYFSGASSGVEVYGFTYGSRVEFRVRGHNSSGSSDWTSSSIATVAPKTPTLSLKTNTPGQIVVTVSGLSGSWDSFTVYKYDTNWNLLDTITYAGGYDAIFSANPGQTYYFMAKSFLTVDGYTFQSLIQSSVLNVTNTQASNRPSNFSWVTQKISGQSFNLTAAEWNSFTSRINQFRDYKGLSLVSFIQAAQGSNFYASMFNEARNAIAAMNSSGIVGTVSSGSLVYANYLNNLVTTLNNVA